MTNHHERFQEAIGALGGRLAIVLTDDFEPLPNGTGGIQQLDEMFKILYTQTMLSPLAILCEKEVEKKITRTCIDQLPRWLMPESAMSEGFPKDSDDLPIVARLLNPYTGTDVILIPFEEVTRAVAIGQLEEKDESESETEEANEAIRPT